MEWGWVEWGECTVLWNLTALHATIPSSAAPAAPPSTPPSSSTRSLGPGSDSALFPIQVGTRNQEGKGSVVSTRRRKEKKGEERRRKKKKEEERRRKKKKEEERRRKKKAFEACSLSKIMPRKYWGGGAPF